MNIKILGLGCTKCHELERLTREVIKELSIDVTITEVKDMKAIMKYPILTTPGLVINERLVSSGKVPSKGEITSYITTALVNQEEAK